MRRMLAVGVAALVVAGCSTGTTADCPVIADDAIALLQDFVNEVDALSEAGDGASLDTGFVTRLEAQAADLDERSAAAGCSEDAMSELLAERSDVLQASTEAGEAMVELILSDQFFTP